jgi:hypothetical protein
MGANMGNVEYRCHFYTFHQDELLGSYELFTSQKLVAWIGQRSKRGAKEIIPHLLKRTTNYNCRDNNRPKSEWPDDDMFFIENIDSIEPCLLKLSGRPELVGLVESSDSIKFRRYCPSIDPLPRNRMRPPNAEEVMALEKKYYRPVRTDQGSFPFEENLEHSILENLDKIEKGLKLYDLKSRSGKHNTHVGEIDILCRDINDDLVVIELKKGSPGDKSVGQIAKYIGWAEEKHPAKKVKGIIIARSMNEKLRLAAKALRVEVHTYEVTGLENGFPLVILTRMV